MNTWRIKKTLERRIKSRHPWVFSNELLHSPKGHPQGELVRLEDQLGNFLAWGYGNPVSLISFRALSFNSDEKDFYTPQRVTQKLFSSWRLRHQLGFRESFRLCFSEADFLPGLIVDYYRSADHQVFAFQVLTAGMERLMQEALPIFESLVNQSHTAGFSDISWNQTAVVLRNDVNIRKLEGLEVLEPKVLKHVDELDLSQVQINVLGTSLTTDLIEGQKTGFFLDQSHNIKILSNYIQNLKRPLKVLDLCCYVGQWSVALASLGQKMNQNVDVTLVDASQKALDLAEQNVKKLTPNVTTQKMDVLQDLKNLPDHGYDIVISDPPAFIKGKKDIPQGKHAYLKLNSQAFRLTKRDGILVACSCSGLLEEIEFKEILARSMLRAGRQAVGILRGGHSADHPILPQFPEGHYLKMLAFHLSH